jgi:2,3-bisphosphoglycerate-independent phosphoglycerate mutase
LKYVVVLYDGMADLPVPELDGKTPMMVANKPLLDSLASRGEFGLVQTIPNGMSPGSDIANMSVMGFDPNKYYTGRSPLEALSIGINLKDTDVSLRCNLVTLSDDKNYEDKTMIDYCAGDIKTSEAYELIKSVEKHLGNDEFKFYSGVSYRHCLIWNNGTTDIANMTPPHDISGRVVKDYLSSNKNAKPLIDMMKKSCEILSNHPINLKRIENGKSPANSIWLWGEGKKPMLPAFQELYGMSGSVISAVDLLKGIGKGAKMSTPDVDGVTGYIDTNFEGKAMAALKELENGADYVYIHIEAPDECGHRKEIENKVRSIELIDERVLKPLLEGLEKFEDYKIMALPDHPTPIVTGTHSSQSVPFMIFHNKNQRMRNSISINEETAKNTGIVVSSGTELMKRFLNN